MSTSIAAISPEAYGVSPNLRGGPSASAAIRIVAVRELSEHIASARFLVIALMVFCLTPLAVYVGVKDYQTRLGEFDRLSAQSAELINGPVGERGVAGNDAENDRIMLRALHRPEPLSVLIRGLDGALPQYWEFTAIGSIAGPAAASPQRVADLLGQLDIEFLVRVVLGLLAILIAFDAVAGEKEAGTLRAVLSQPLPRAAFLTGKLVGGAITLLVPLIALVLLALLSAKLFGVDLLVPDTLLKVMLIMLSGGFYVLCLYALGLLVSSMAANQKTSLVILLVGWVIAVLAIPSISTLLAQAASPLPPANAVATQKDAIRDDLQSESMRSSGAVYREVTGEPPGGLSGSVFAEHREAIEARVTPIMVQYLSDRRRLLGEIDEDMERRRQRQTAISRGIMMLSPAALFAGTASDLSNTGDSSREAWLEAVRLQQVRLNQALFDDPPIVGIENQGATMYRNRRESPGITELPSFVEPRRDAAAAVARTLPRIAALLLYTALFIAAAFTAFHRYDVR